MNKKYIVKGHSKDYPINFATEAKAEFKAKQSYFCKFFIENIFQITLRSM